jgi:hypothetical protein
MKFKLIIISFFCLFVLTGFSYSKRAFPVQFRGIEISYGAYDIMGAVDLNILGWRFLSFKPNIRYAPFSQLFKWGMLFEYYPMTMFDLNFWIFGDTGLNPFVFTGLEFQEGAKAAYVPLGIGVQSEVFSDVYLGLRVYMDMYFHKIGVYAGWDFTLEYKFF